MSKSFITKTIDGILTSKVTDLYEEIKKEAGKSHRSKITVEPYTEAKEWSDGQRKWWKGVLLPALSKDNGDSILAWENKLKKEVMPEAFPTITEEIDGVLYGHLPSITTLGQENMNIMVEESVAYLRDGRDEHDEKGCGLMWVTLPDKLKKKKELK